MIIKVLLLLVVLLVFRTCGNATVNFYNSNVENKVMHPNYIWNTLKIYYILYILNIVYILFISMEAETEQNLLDMHFIVTTAKTHSPPPHCTHIHCLVVIQ